MLSDGGGVLFLCYLVSAIPTIAAVILTVILWARREPRGSVVELLVATSGMAVAGTLTWEATLGILIWPLVGVSGVLVGVAWMVTSVLLTRGSPHFARVAVGVASATLLFHVALVVLYAMNAPSMVEGQTDQVVLATVYLIVALPAATALAIVAVRARIAAQRARSLTAAA